VTRAERLMELLVDEQKLTPSGKDFLIAALDPMHDNQLKDLQGWPDLETSSSVVRCIKQTVSVKVPEGVDGPWDLNIVQWPWLDRQACSVMNRTNNVLTNLGSSPVMQGGLCGYAGEAGSPTNPAMTPAFQITLDDTYSLGAGRVVGLGFEVIDTTSELNKQGRVICWRQSNASATSSKSTAVIRSVAGTQVDCITSVSPIMEPPSNGSDAMLLPGSRQWEAKDGCYVVVPFVGQDNPPTLVNYDVPMTMLAPAADSTFNQPSGVTNTTQVLVPTPKLGSHAGDFPSEPAKIYPLHMAGAYFQGLNPLSTLSITLNVYLETFPTVAQKDLVVLATPSAEYDPVALQMFSHALTQLPVGVPAGFNSFGDWFIDTVSTLSDWLTVPLGAVSPALGAGVAAAGALAKGYRKTQGYDTQPSPQNKPKNPKQVVRQTLNKNQIKKNQQAARQLMPPVVPSRRSKAYRQMLAAYRAAGIR